MTRTPHTFDCTDAEAALVTRLIALNEELQALAASAPDGTVREACENTVLERGREIQTQLLQTAVASRVEAAEKKAPLRLCECGQAKDNRGPKTRHLVTAVGVIAIRRRYWQCRCGRPGSYAVDELLGLEGRFSRVLQKHCCRLAADTSFAATSEHLREMLGVRLAAESVRTLVESHARAMAKF